MAPARSPYARRVALWRLGAAAPAVGVQGGSQLALPLALPDAPDLRPLSRWEAMVADYATTGMTVHDHPMAVLRDGLRHGGAVASTDLERLRHGTPVDIAGLVVARQRPGTAKGVAFLLLEDELGTVNIIVPPPVYERDRLAVRAEPLVIAEGTLERFASAGGAVNVLVRRLRRLDVAGLRDGVADQAAADRVADLQERARRREEEARRAQEAQDERVAAGAGGGEDFRAVAPPVLSFTHGRRR
jgi:error-prone DNA polymerase